jgi:hypothetical protein
VTDPDKSKDMDLDLELELQPDVSSTEASPTTEGQGDGVEGQWVWQYAAPPPPPSFLAVFFSGTAHKELYRFFACSLLVVIGCMLPWGPVTEKSIDSDGVAIESVLPRPDVMGYETPAGAISLALGLWLLFSSCYGIYTRRQKILPVFLMLEPAIVTLLRIKDAWGKLKSEGTLDKLGELFEVAGTGVMFTFIGSGIVAIGFLFLLVKVYTKKDDKGSGRRSSREKGGEKDGKKGGKKNAKKNAKRDSKRKGKGGDKKAEGASGSKDGESDSGKDSSSGSAEKKGDAGKANGGAGA